MIARWVYRWRWSRLQALERLAALYAQEAREARARARDLEDQVADLERQLAALRGGGADD